MNELMGILPVMKPAGWTSFDVVAKLRGILRIKRIGHGGTLDPMATGVLPVFVGKAARCCDILPDKRKSYTAGFRFGVTTDTLDITGSELTSSDKAVTLADIERLIPQFTGDIMQLPPMYSAVKINGRKLYELAREGKSAERKPRQVHIDRIEIAGYDETSREGVMKLDCGQGTYVRSLIDDLGAALGCGGIMTSLTRTRSGGFSLAECHTLERIAAAANEGRIGELLLPTDRAFSLYPEVTLGERETALYKNGVRLREDQVILPCEAEQYRVYANDGGFLGLGKKFGELFGGAKNFY